MDDFMRQIALLLLVVLKRINDVYPTHKSQTAYLKRKRNKVDP